jgi:hypothetical protein
VRRRVDVLLVIDIALDYRIKTFKMPMPAFRRIANIVTGVVRLFPTQALQISPLSTTNVMSPQDV